jgi:hydrogenase/urease accessory protein HupE
LHPGHWLGIAAAIAIAGWPAGAEAHLVTTGLGPVYDGIAHFALTPEDSIPVLALALLAGLRGATHGRRALFALFALPAAWLVAGLVGLATPGGGVPLTSISFVVLGALVAVDTALPVYAITLLAVLLGVVHGMHNGAAMAQAARAALNVVGIALAVFACVALAASLIVPLRTGWTRVTVRVAGSWIAALGLLLLGWSFRAGA